MSILSLNALSLSIGEQCLFDATNLQINAKDKIALIGRNGEGKSTLLKLMAGLITPDKGRLIKSPQLSCALLGQEVPSQTTGCVFDVVIEELGETGQLLLAYQHALNDDNQSIIGSLASRIEMLDGWAVSAKVNTLLSRLGIAPTAAIDSLSGGMKRRVMLAKALLGEPELLLLDEPTNHLDIDSIEWLEAFLQDYCGAFVLVTHDRAFLSKTATRIVEIDRAKIYDYEGDYSQYLKKKEARLAEEKRHDALFDKRLGEEEKWIRQGIKARRTRNEGRVRALEKMRSQRAARRLEQKTMSGVQAGSAQSGKMVIEAQSINFSHDGNPLIKDFSLLLMRGDKLGIVGPNGCGKTTLLNCLLGTLVPDRGSIKSGTRLNVAYFDQLRSQLDDKLSVMDNVAQGRSEITVNGKTRHVVSYLQDFLFSPKRIKEAITKLSGGERNRLLLAKLLTQDVNVLVMDEPTNDLDIEALEMLEAMLVEFQGTLLVVSHDREFLNNVVTSVLVYSPDKGFEEFVGGYSDYQRAKPKEKISKKVLVKEAKKPRSKLNYNEQRELNQLPAKIEQLEKDLEALQVLTASGDFYQQSPQEITKTQTILQQKEQELEDSIARWEELESRHG